MLITPKQVKNLTYIVVDDMYEPNEVLQIKAELLQLLTQRKQADATGSAVDGNSNVKKSGMGLFLDRYYQERSQSSILNLNRKLFCEDIVQIATQANQFFNTIRQCNEDTTLINYYENGQEYKEHMDTTAITAVTFFALGEVAGGDLLFPMVNETVPFKENRVVIFAGCTPHAATPSIVQKNSYRVSIAQFLNYRN
jgi:hypothetical protein